jgi:hypothetical protein
VNPKDRRYVRYAGLQPAEYVFNLILGPIERIRSKVLEESVQYIFDRFYRVA